MKKYLIVSSIAILALVSIAGAQEFTFLNNLSVNSTGPDVSALQSWLVSNGYDIPAISSGTANKGFFGLQTRMALMKYQYNNGIPNTGYFGSMTRGRLNGIYHLNNGPVISSVTGPTTLAVGATGTWTISATDPRNGPLNYSVIWGDETRAVAAPSSGESALYKDFTQSTTFTHIYSNSGIYNIRFAVRDVTGKIANKSAIVNVGNVAGSLRITSPNGGESWKIGTTQNITWTSPQYIRATYADLKLVPSYQPCTGQICPMGAVSSNSAQSMMYPYHAPYMIAQNISINQNSYSWNVGNYIPEVTIMIYPVPESIVPAGQYLIQICETGTSNCESSDAPFKIYSDSSANKAPVINGIDAPTTLSINQIGTWTVRASDPENGQLSYSVDWGDVNYVQNAAIDTRAGSVYSQSTSFTHSYSEIGVYTIVFTVRDNLGLESRTTTTISVGTCPIGTTLEYFNPTTKRCLVILPVAN